MNMKRMSQMFSINRELRVINRKIDHKIVKGLSYEKESARHRNLVTQLRQLESEASLARTFAMASFLF
jgi:hypothetical protein